MNGNSEAQDWALREALHDRGKRTIAETADVWPRIEMRLQQGAEVATLPQGRRTLRFSRPVVAALLLGVVVLAGAAGALASPLVRQAIGGPSQATAVVMGPGPVLDSVSPPVPFQILNLSYVPSGLTSYQFTRLIVTAHSWSAIGAYGPFDETSLGKEVLQLDAEGVNGVLLRFQEPPPGGSYVEVIEQVPTAGAVTGGEAVTINGAAARVAQEGAVTAIRLPQPGMLITIRTNLGESEALQVAKGLRQQRR